MTSPNTHQQYTAMPDLGIPLVDPNTGVINYAWYQFLVNLWQGNGSGTIALPSSYVVAGNSGALVAHNVSTGGTSPVGSVGAVVAGTGLTGGTISNSGTIGIAITGVAAGTYGASNAIPVVAINAEGQVTHAANVTLAPAGVAALGTMTGSIVLGNGLAQSGGAGGTLALGATLTGETLAGTTANLGTISGGTLAPAVLNGGTIANAVSATLTNGLGVWGHTSPGSQPATPTTLAQVISALQAYGLTA